MKVNKLFKTDHMRPHQPCFSKPRHEDIRDQGPTTTRGNQKDVARSLTDGLKKSPETSSRKIHPPSQWQTKPLTTSIVGCFLSHLLLTSDCDLIALLSPSASHPPAVYRHSLQLEFYYPLDTHIHTGSHGLHTCARSSASLATVQR